jgi:hypothetical protein
VRRGARWLSARIPRFFRFRASNSHPLSDRDIVTLPRVLTASPQLVSWCPRAQSFHASRASPWLDIRARQPGGGGGHRVPLRARESLSRFARYPPAILGSQQRGATRTRTRTCKSRHNQSHERQRRHGAPCLPRPRKGGAWMAKHFSIEDSRGGPAAASDGAGATPTRLPRIPFRM